MATITVEVEDTELGFLRELLTKFSFVKINEEEAEDSDEAMVRSSNPSPLRERSQEA